MTKYKYIYRWFFFYSHLFSEVVILCIVLIRVITYGKQIDRTLLIIFIFEIFNKEITEKKIGHLFPQFGLMTHNRSNICSTIDIERKKTK